MMLTAVHCANNIAFNSFLMEQKAEEPLTPKCQYLYKFHKKWTPFVKKGGPFL